MFLKKYVFLGVVVVLNDELKNFLMGGGGKKNI